MTFEQFAYWLQGYAELNEAPPSPAQWKSIQEHLATVFTKVTPPLGTEPSKEIVEAIQQGRTIVSPKLVPPSVEKILKEVDQSIQERERKAKDLVDIAEAARKAVEDKKKRDQEKLDELLRKYGNNQPTVKPPAIDGPDFLPKRDPYVLPTPFPEQTFPTPGWPVGPYQPNWPNWLQPGGVGPTFYC